MRIKVKEYGVLRTNEDFADICEKIENALKTKNERNALGWLRIFDLWLLRCAYGDSMPWLPPPPLSREPIERIVVDDGGEDNTVDLVGE